MGLKTKLKACRQEVVEEEWINHKAVLLHGRTFTVFPLPISVNLSKWTVICLYFVFLFIFVFLFCFSL